MRQPARRFAYRLALALGCRTLHELHTGERAPMLAEDLVEWQAYHELEPWGETRMDWRFGQLCAQVANILKGADDAPARAADFVPDFDGEKEAAGPRGVDAEESREALRSLAERPGGEARKGGALA